MKTRVALASFLIFLLSLCLTGYAEAQRWDFTYNAEGWTGRNGTVIQHASDPIDWKGLYVWAYGDDPGIVSPSLSLSASTNNLVKMRVATYCSNKNSVLYFKRSGSSNVYYGTSVYLSFGTNWGEYEFDLSGVSDWSGTITEIRIDPSDSCGSSGSPVLIGVDWIETSPKVIQPSLTVSTTSLQVGESIHITCNLTSAGANRPVSFFINSKATGNTLASKSATADFSGLAVWSPDPVAQDNWQPTVSVACRDDVTQVTTWQDVQVTPPPKPDLTISSISFTNTVRNTGDQENISVTVNRSNGQLIANTYVLVRVYASSNTTITTADTYLGEFSSTDFPSNTLNSSGSLTRSKQFNMPSTCGNYYIGAIVDPTDYHDESNEGNNSRAGNQMVVGKITVTNPNSSGITWYKGSPQTVTWTSCPNVTGNVQIQFYKGGSPSENITGSTSNDGTHPFTVSNSLQDGTDYQVGISAMSGQIWDYSDNNFTIIDEPPPNVPLNVSSIQTSNGIRISWSSVSGVGGATPYMIYWGNDPSLDENNKSGILTTDQTIYDHTGLDSGVIYYYRVKACNNTNCSELSDVTSAQAPLADLTISLTSIPANANVQQGNSYPITCTVSRTGGLLRPTTGYARVFVYMNQSTDPGTVTSEHLVLGDAGLSSFDFSNTALDDGSETQTINVPIPTTIEGPFYVHVKVDGAEYWAESDENNNWDSSQQDEELIVWRPGVPLPNEQMGVLARTWNNAYVYWIKYGKKWLLSGIASDPGYPVEQLGYSDAEIEWYGSAALDGFASGKTILLDNDNFVYRKQSVSTVYIVRNGVSDWFFNWDAFINSEFGTEDVYWAKDTGFDWIQSVYPLGQMIGLMPRIRVEPNKLYFK